jgi:hypothetical protein
MVIWFIQGICGMNILFLHSVGGVFSAFPWVFMAAAFWQRRARWKELLAGECWHTYSGGISFLERLPFMPAYFKDQRRIYRILEPALCFFLSMGVGILLSPGLARWMALSAIAMASTSKTPTTANWSAIWIFSTRSLQAKSKVRPSNTSRDRRQASRFSR